MKPPESSRLSFRPVETGDAAILFAGAFGCEAVVRHLQWECHARPADTARLIAGMIRQHERGEKFFWLAADATAGQAVALGSIRPGNGTGWIGFLLWGLALPWLLVEPAEAATHRSSTRGVSEHSVLLPVKPANWESLAPVQRDALSQRFEAEHRVRQRLGPHGVYHRRSPRESGRRRLSLSASDGEQGRQAHDESAPMHEPETTPSSYRREPAAQSSAVRLGGWH